MRVVYSPLDAVKLARKHPDREVVFFAIGFETTTPPTALAIRQGMLGLEHPDVAQSLGDLAALLQDQDLAALIYTSGSTGTPKVSVAYLKPSCIHDLVDKR